MAETTTAKKSAGKSAGTKSAGKKAPAKKAPAKRAARKAPARAEDGHPARRSAPRAQAPRSREESGSAGGQVRGSRVAAAAREAVLDLTGKSVESVTGLERRDGGWTVEVEVLELERIPSTTDVLATYEVGLDDDGELEGYRRVRRYLRGSPSDE